MIKNKSELFELKKLPYDQSDLFPYISPQTLDYHYNKHHRGYVHNLNKLVADTEFEGLPLEKIITGTQERTDQTALFNNAAQVWNHDFYWNSLTPKGGGKPDGEFGKKIEAGFGGYDNFLKQFIEAGMSNFGSGWIWLVEDGNVLKITKTSNAQNPLSQGQGKALLTIDVWEHAYYLEHKNKREDYLKTCFEHLLNWRFAQMNLDSECQIKEQ